MAGASSASPLVVLHGFPGSSRDWTDVVPLLPAEREVVTFDFPGYGADAKDPRRSYSLFDQATYVEELLAARGVGSAVLLAHDMGDTVAAELATRHNAGMLGFRLDGIVLTNGSIFIDLAQLTRGQRLTLRLPARRLPFPMPTWVLRRSLEESFTEAAPPPPGAIDALIEEIRRNDGDRLMPILIRYIEERRQHQARWTAGFVEYDGPLGLVWGRQDPIAVFAMAERLVSLRPGTRLVTLPDVGHWPSLEAPTELAAAVTSLLSDWSGGG